MSHFAQVIDGIVQQVIVAEQDFIDSGFAGDPAQWIQTSYNTRGNRHFYGGIPLRGNYAGPGFIYDKENDVFYEPRPFDSWTLNTSTWTWDPPVPIPDNTKRYYWDEATLSWIEDQ